MSDTAGADGCVREEWVSHDVMLHAHLNSNPKFRTPVGWPHHDFTASVFGVAVGTAFYVLVSNIVFDEYPLYLLRVMTTGGVLRNTHPRTQHINSHWIRLSFFMSHRKKGFAAGFPRQQTKKDFSMMCVFVQPTPRKPPKIPHPHGEVRSKLERAEPLLTHRFLL